MKSDLQVFDVQRSLLRSEPTPPKHGLRRPESIWSYEGRKPWRKQVRSAFTLIELLVVIGVIAVLAAMLLPALSMAKNRAQMVIDLNNVRQILLATRMYATDNNDYLPRTGQQNDVVSLNGEKATCWAWGIPSYTPNTGTSGTLTTYQTYYPWQVKSFHGLKSDGTPMTRANCCQFVPYLKNEKVLRCPGDIPNPLMYKRQVYITSYVWNGSLICPEWNSPTAPYGTYKLSQFNADDIFLFENDELRVLVDGGQWDNADSDPKSGISGRHGKGATVGNADGSAERILLSDWYKWANDGVNRNRVYIDPTQVNGHHTC